MRTTIVMPLAEQRGGSEMVLLHLLQAGQGQGIDWSVVFLEDGPMLEQCRKLGATCDVIDAGRLRQPLKLIGTIRRLRRWFEQHGSDLVIGWAAKAHLYAGPAAKRAGVPVAWFQHGLPTPGFNIDGLATRLASRCVLVCSKTVGEAQRRLKPVRDIRVAYPAVELERFDPQQLPTPVECRQQLGLPTTGPLIGMTARLQHWKGVHVLIDATSKLLPRYPDLHCVIVGGEHRHEPEYPQRLREQVARLSLPGRVIFAGLQKNVPLWVQAMDVPVHASQAEPFGLVVLEAMALAKPLVAGSTGGPAEIITPGVNGQLAPFGNADALAGAIASYLDDPAYAQRIGYAARQRAMEFSTHRFAADFIAAAKELAAMNNP